jgi:ribosomal protein S6
VKEVALKVVEGGGIVRGVENHGIRSLPHRFKAKHPDREGNRYYEKGRFFSIYYDSNPKTMQNVERVLSKHEEVLRQTHLKVRNKLWYVNIDKEDKNPYIQRVLAMETQAKEGKSNIEE